MTQMKGKRRRHEPEFKARIAIEAIKGIKTVQQIAKELDIHPVQVSEWKKVMVDGASGLFASGSRQTSEEQLEKEKEKLHAKIGQQAVEIDFLRKKSKQLGL